MDLVSILLLQQKLLFHCYTRAALDTLILHAGARNHGLCTVWSLWTNIQVNGVLSQACNLLTGSIRCVEV